MIIHILQVREQSLQGVGQLALNQPGLPMLYRYINLPNLSSLKEQEFIFHSRGRQVSGGLCLSWSFRLPGYTKTGSFFLSCYCRGPGMK